VEISKIEFGEKSGDKLAFGSNSVAKDYFGQSDLQKISIAIQNTQKNSISDFSLGVDTTYFIVGQLDYSNPNNSYFLGVF
jgi:hypothetical protein